MPTGSATASTATGSGGAIAAPIARAIATVIPGTHHMALPATARAEAVVSKTEYRSTERQRRLRVPHENFTPIAHRSGGRKIGRIISESISRCGLSGSSRAPTPRIVIITGQGKLSRSPTPTIMTVASRISTMMDRYSIGPSINPLSLKCVINSSVQEVQRKVLPPHTLESNPHTS